MSRLRAYRGYLRTSIRLGLHYRTVVFAFAAVTVTAMPSGYRNR